MKIQKLLSLIIVSLLLVQTLTHSRDWQDEGKILDDAKFAESQKNYKEAEDLYRRLEKKYPTKINYLSIGEYFARRKDFKKATRYFYKAYNNLAFDYNQLEDLFHKYEMHNELLKLYLKEKDITDRVLKRRFSRKAIRWYKLLSKHKKAIHFIIKKIEKADRPVTFEFRSIVGEISESDETESFYFIELYDIAMEENLTDDVILQLKKLKKKKLKLFQYYLIEKFLGILYFKKRDYEKSYFYYQKAIQRDQYSPYELEKLFHQFKVVGQHRLRLKLVDQYVKVLQKRKKTQQDSPILFQSMLIKAKLHLKLGEQKKAEDIYLKILSRKSKGLDRFIKNEAYLNLGKIYFAKNQYEKAKNMFLTIDNPGMISAKIYVARCKLAVDDYDGAFNILVLTGNNSRSIYYKALIRLFQSKTQSSIKLFEKVILRYGQSDMALRALEKLEMLYQIKDDKKKLKSFIRFEKLLDRLDYNSLLSHYKDVLSLYSGNEDQKSYFQLHYAVIYTYKKDYYKALRILKSIEASSKHPFWIQKSSFLLGQLYIERLNKKEEGLKLLQELKRKYPRTLFLQSANELIKKHSPKADKKGKRRPGPS